MARTPTSVERPQRGSDPLEVTLQCLRSVMSRSPDASARRFWCELVVPSNDARLMLTLEAFIHVHVLAKQEHRDALMTTCSEHGYLYM